MQVDRGGTWPWKQLLPTNASWWELAAAAVTVTVAFRHSALSLFYARFGVSPEEVGIGVTTIALQAGILIVALLVAANAVLVYIYARLGSGPWRRLKARLKRLSSSKHGLWLVSSFCVHRVVVIASVIAFVWVLGMVDAEQSITFGGIEVQQASVLLAAFVAIWIVLGFLNRPFRKSATDQTQDEDRAADRRFAVRVMLWMVMPLAVVFVATPLFWASREARAVAQGHGVSAPLAIPWQASPATIKWLGEPDTGVAEASTHCLMYLGSAGGVTVFFDVDDQVTLRLPTADLIVVAAPIQSPGGSPVRSRCTD